MAHLLSCRLVDEVCTADDLATVTERAKAPACGRKLCEGTTEEAGSYLYTSRILRGKSNRHVVIYRQLAIKYDANTLRASLVARAAGNRLRR